MDVAVKSEVSSKLEELGRLLTELSRLHDERRRPSGKAPSNVAIWEDSDYLYLEWNLKKAWGGELDISLHEGTLFLRMEP